MTKHNINNFFNTVIVWVTCKASVLALHPFLHFLLCSPCSNFLSEATSQSSFYQANCVTYLLKLYVCGSVWMSRQYLLHSSHFLKSRVVMCLSLDDFAQKKLTDLSLSVTPGHSADSLVLCHSITCLLSLICKSRKWRKEASGVKLPRIKLRNYCGYVLVS